MHSLLVIIRPILSATFPFIVLHFYAQHYYQISLWDIIKWWSSNFTKANDSGAIVFGLFFSWLVLSMSFSGFMNIIYLSFVGKTQELVYLGHEKEYTARYYQLNDINKKVMSVYDPEIQYNDSFDNLFRSQKIIVDPLTPESYGTSANRFELSSYLSVTAALAAFLLITLPMFNAIAHPVYQTSGIVSGISTEGAMLAFDDIITRYHISQVWYFSIVSILLIIWISCFISTPDNTKSSQLEALPAYISPGTVITGTPVEMIVRYNEITRSDGSTRSIDSGDRYVNLRFESDFIKPVYVCAMINKNSHKMQLVDITNSIKTHQSIEVEITKDLGVIIPDDGM